MNQKKRFCNLQGHEQFQLNQVCTYRWCDMNRLCCLQCLCDNIHRHSIPNSNHIMNQAKFLTKVKQDIQNLKNEYLQRKQGTNIQNTQQQLVKDFQELQVIDNQISDDDSFKLQQLLQKVEAQNFIQLNDEDINRLIDIYQYQFNYDVQLQLQDSKGKEQNVNQYQENINNKFIDFKQRQYDIKIIYLTNDDEYIKSSLISNNEQYLVYNIRDLLDIYQLKVSKIYKKLKQQRIPTTFQFTNDSTKLFTGHYEGYVYGYFVTNGFKIFYKQKIHQNIIRQIIIQKYYLITASDDRTIIKTNFINKNQIFVLVGHSKRVHSIDYDILKDILISTSWDESLKIWDCQNQSILIDHDLSDQSYGQIQLINNKQDIIRCGKYGFKKFTIDYQNRKLVEIYSYRELGNIQGFQYVNNDQNLLLILDDQLQIINEEGELINRIYHNLNLNSSYYLNRTYRQQLDSLNYIILQDSKLLYYIFDYKLCLQRVKEIN